MPDIRELGRRVKAKYPQYNDLDDAELGRRVKAKYPGAYDDFTDAPAAPTQSVFESFQTGVAGPLLRNVVETAVDVYNRPLETLERAGRAGLEFVSAFDPAGAAYEPTVKGQAERVAELKRRAEAERPETIKLIERGMREEEAKPRTRAGRIAFGTGRIAGEVAFPTNPETIVQNIATVPFGGAAAKSAGVVFKAGVNSIRRTFGKGVAQMIEAEATPAAVAQVRREIGESPALTAESPPVIGEAIPSPVPAIDPLQTAFSKLGTDNVEQIGAMIANANKRLGKKRTPEQIQSSLDDYKALQQLTPDENRALSQVLPMRNFAPITSTGAARDIQNIPMSEFELDPQGAANLRGAMSFFDEQGRLLQEAEDAAIMGDIGPGATSGQMIAQPARVSAADLITTPPSTGGRISPETGPPALSADLGTAATPSVRAASAGVTGPRVGADLDALNVAASGGGARPPAADINAPWLGGPAPRGQQQLFDAAARSPWQDTALAYFRANVLTNPVGRALDLASTVVNQFADAAARPIAAAVDVVVSKLTGKRSITGPNIRDTGRALGSIRQGLRDAREVLRTGQQAIDTGADDVLYGREIRSGLGRVFDVPVNGLFRLMGALDAPFRRFAFARNLQDRARVAAINEAKRGRIPRDQTVARARELIDRPDIIQAAVRDGEKAVLSESNAISSWVAAQTRNSPNARLAFGLLQPFVRIPLNAVFKAADFAGVGGVKALYKIARGGVRKAKGQSFFRDLEEQRVFAQNVAAGSFAPAAFMLGMELEDQGKLEGYFYTGRRDFPGRRSPTSIDIGGTRYDIQRLGGYIAAPLFVGATYNRLRKQDVGKANALLRSFSGLVQQAPALGYHGAPAKAGRILSADEPSQEMLKETGNVASGFIPASGALGATAKALDPMKKRETEGFTGPIMSKIPILREQLPATGNDAIDAAVDRNSPLLLELQRLNVRIAELQRGKDKQGKIEPDEQFNARVQQFGRNYTSYGLRLIQDSRFQAASDEVKARALKRLSEKAKGLTRKEFAFPELELDPGLILDSVQK